MKKILLVDDDIDDQDLMIDALHTVASNILVNTQMNGNMAIKYLMELTEHELPDLILLDYNLPELNGSEILEALSKHARFDSIPKIIWSTSSSGLYEERCMAQGAKAYLVKPSDMKGIIALAEKVIGFAQN